jgi:parvulin-like peptidyl-prolyl isomerase
VKKLIPIIAALALTLAACSSSDDTAATVNGEEIPASLVEDFAGGPDADAATVSQALATLIQWSITEQAAAEQFSYAPTDDEIQDQVDEIVAQAGVGSLEELADGEGVPEEVLRRYILQLMVQDAVTAEFESSLPAPGDDAVSTELTDNEANWTFVCTTHLLVETEDEARAALQRIENGEAFADVAADVSTDTASAVQGGDLGCSAASGFVEPFAQAAMTAELGTPTGPVESQFGFHVLVVSSRELATADDVRSSLLSDAVLAAADAWFLEVTSAADVEVGDGFGTWVTEPNPAIIPPS